MDWLNGKKTYLIAIAIGAVSVVHQLGWIDSAAYTTIVGLLGAGGLGTLRAGVEKGKI